MTVCDGRRLATLALIVTFAEGADLTSVQGLGFGACAPACHAKKMPSVHRQGERRDEKESGAKACALPPDIQCKRVWLACKGSHGKDKLKTLDSAKRGGGVRE